MKHFQHRSIQDGGPEREMVQNRPYLFLLYCIYIFVCFSVLIFLFLHRYIVDIVYCIVILSCCRGVALHEGRRKRRR